MSSSSTSSSTSSPSMCSPSPSSSLPLPISTDRHRSDLQEVFPHLFITNFFASRNLKKLKKSQITHIIVSAYELDCPYKDHFEYLHLEILDLENENIIKFLPKTFNFIEKYIGKTENSQNKNNVLLHCAVGQSRSASLIIAYLMWKKSQSYDDTFSQVQKIRPCIMPNNGFKMQLNEWQREGYPLNIQWENESGGGKEEREDGEDYHSLKREMERRENEREKKLQLSCHENEFSSSSSSLSSSSPSHSPSLSSSSSCSSSSSSPRLPPSLLSTPRQSKSFDPFASSPFTPLSFLSLLFGSPSSSIISIVSRCEAFYNECKEVIGGKGKGKVGASSSFSTTSSPHIHPHHSTTPSTSISLLSPSSSSSSLESWQLLQYHKRSKQLEQEIHSLINAFSLSQAGKLSSRSSSRSSSPNITPLHGPRKASRLPDTPPLFSLNHHHQHSHHSTGGSKRAEQGNEEDKDKNVDVPSNGSSPDKESFLSLQDGEILPTLHDKPILSSSFSAPTSSSSSASSSPLLTPKLQHPPHPLLSHSHSHSPGNSSIPLLPLVNASSSPSLSSATLALSHLPIESSPQSVIGIASLQIAEGMIRKANEIISDAMGNGEDQGQEQGQGQGSGNGIGFSVGGEGDGNGMVRSLGSLFATPSSALSSSSSPSTPSSLLSAFYSPSTSSSSLLSASSSSSFSSSSSSSSSSLPSPSFSSSFSSSSPSLSFTPISSSPHKFSSRSRGKGNSSGHIPMNISGNNPNEGNGIGNGNVPEK